jgi:hypothetical protein
LFFHSNTRSFKLISYFVELANEDDNLEEGEDEEEEEEEGEQFDAVSCLRRLLKQGLLDEKSLLAQLVVMTFATHWGRTHECVVHQQVRPHSRVSNVSQAYLWLSCTEYA